MLLLQRVTGVPVLFTCAAILIWTSQVGAAATSSCVTCHLDEDLLNDNLATVKAKKSAMQSGAG